MTNALTATKTPKLSSQGVPDVILVLNKEEKKEKNITNKKEQRRKTTKKKKRTHKQRHMHMHTLKHKQRHTHKQKSTCSYTKSTLNHCRKMEFWNKIESVNSRKTNAARCQSSIVSPGSSKTTPNILKVSSRVPQTQKNHTDQSATQSKSCSVHLFIKDFENPITSLRSAAEAKPVELNDYFQLVLVN